ncbi:hypothetical protein WJT86_01115 [Microvirga sp. W0021]|uniref:Uncharacterized protein n=1 Tax=Hohaiivirga grylli TaxID=3133970 RepID=A0ABV0BG41_9HYPH
MMKKTFAILAMTMLGFSSTTAFAEEMKWNSQPGMASLNYLAYSGVDSSTNVEVAFACNDGGKKTYFIVHQYESDVKQLDAKVGDKVEVTLQIGDVKTALQTEATDEDDNAVRLVAPFSFESPIYKALADDKSLVVSHSGKTETYPLKGITEAMKEFKDDCAD